MLSLWNEATSEFGKFVYVLMGLLIEVMVLSVVTF